MSSWKNPIKRSIRSSIHVFLLCYNESVLLPHAVAHYRSYLPSCSITVYDNESTDNSVEIARSLGCHVISWSSQKIMNEHLQMGLRNNCWKSITRGWVIMADMDEWICIREEELEYERKNGTTILSIRGLDMIGESQTIDLSDIDLHPLPRFVDNPDESKHLCFLRESIRDMHFTPGSHTCSPVGTIVYSPTVYINQHIRYPGLPFLLDKMIKRYERNEQMRAENMNLHYSNDVCKITEEYQRVWDASRDIL